MFKKIVLINTCGDQHKTRTDLGLFTEIKMGPHYPLGTNCLVSYLKKKYLK